MPDPECGPCIGCGSVKKDFALGCMRGGVRERERIVAVVRERADQIDRRSVLVPKAEVLELRRMADRIEGGGEAVGWKERLKTPEAQHLVQLERRLLESEEKVARLSLVLAQVRETDDGR